MLNSSKIGFVGAGQMARAIGFPLINKGFVKSSNVFVSTPEEHFLKDWNTLGCNTSKLNEDTLREADTIIWGIKPQMFRTVVSQLNLSNLDMTKAKFNVSIMSGIPLEKFSDSLNEKNWSYARVMPNIAMSVNAGCAVFTMTKDFKSKDKELLQYILSNLGMFFEVQEDKIDAYCGLFSSGLGFMFPILEAMSDGGVKMGIPRDQSIIMAAQTMKGAAELILQTKSHPAQFKDSVCSPGGTTIAGVTVLEEKGIRSGIISAIEAATKRGEELGRM